MTMYPEVYWMEEAISMIVPYLTSAIPTSILSIAVYVLSSVGLYSMASRRGIGHAWFSWIPVLDMWILGSLSDQYRYVTRGQVKAKRKSLVILNLLSGAIVIAMVVLAAVMVVELINGAVYGVSENELLRIVMSPVIIILCLILPLVVISVAATIIRYIALYDVYMSADPNNGVLFLVLSILFNVTEPFFLFFNRDKDLGMPPRRPVYQQIPQNQGYNNYNGF